LFPDLVLNFRDERAATTHRSGPFLWQGWKLAKLPSGGRVAHKTGSTTGVRHDSGIVCLPNGKKYVLVLLSRNLKDVSAGVDALAEVSAMIYKAVAKAK
jgi:beta-lactamase class A